MCLLGLIASLTANLPKCCLHMRNIQIQLHVLSKVRSHKHPLSCRILATSRVIHIALRHLRKHLSGQSVLVKCDNMSIVMYLNKMGGARSRSLCRQTVRLLLWCSRRRFSIQAAHLPGADNTLADSLSRRSRGTVIKGPAKIHGSSVDWHLNKTVCLTLFNKVARPLIDLFVDSRKQSASILL